MDGHADVGSIGRNGPPGCRPRRENQLAAAVAVDGCFAVQHWQASGTHVEKSYSGVRSRHPAVAGKIDREPATTEQCGGCMKSKPKSMVAPVLTSALLLFFTLVLYVLSIGPAWWLHHNGYLNHQLYMTVYAPLIWCYYDSAVCQLAEWLSNGRSRLGLLAGGASEALGRRANQAVRRRLCWSMRVAYHAGCNR